MLIMRILRRNMENIYSVVLNRNKKYTKGYMHINRDQRRTDRNKNSFMRAMALDHYFSY